MKKGLLLIMASGFIALGQAMEGGAYSVLGGTPRTFMNDIKNYLHIVLTLNDGTEVKGDLQGTPDNAVEPSKLTLLVPTGKNVQKITVIEPAATFNKKQEVTSKSDKDERWALNTTEPVVLTHNRVSPTKNLRFWRVEQLDKRKQSWFGKTVRAIESTATKAGDAISDVVKAGKGY